MTSLDSRAGRPKRPALLRIDRELLIVDLCILVFASVLFWVSTDLSEVARRAPTWILATLLVLVVGDLAIMRRHVVLGLTFLDEPQERVDEPMRLQLACLGSLVACGLLIYFIGYRWATPIFLTGFLLAMRVRLKVLVPYVVASSAFIYFIFSEVLRVR